MISLFNTHEIVVPMKILFMIDININIRIYLNSREKFEPGPRFVSRTFRSRFEFFSWIWIVILQGTNYRFVFAYQFDLKKKDLLPHLRRWLVAQLFLQTVS